MNRQRKYLNNQSITDAILSYQRALHAVGIGGPLQSESIPIAEALGRVTAEAMYAKLSSPSYHSSAMDGVAVRFIDTLGAGETRPKRLRVPEQAIYVDTGDPMPDNHDAVIMIEDVEKISETEIEILKPATPWQHVRLVGEDIIATEMIIFENHKIRPVDMAAMIASGHTSVLVHRRPVVTIIPTGSELIEPGNELVKGSIIDFNSTMLSALAAECGAQAIKKDIVKDDVVSLKKKIEESLSDSDIVLINAGSSAGREDFTAEGIAELGQVIVHGVSMKPGKPVILGIAQGKPVIGLPGYPVSAALTFGLFVKPLILVMQGLKAVGPDTALATLSRQVASGLGKEEVIRVKLGKVSDKLIATPVSRGAGVLMSLARADGIIRVPAQLEGLPSGQQVTVELLRPLQDIEKTIVCIGSHDPALDILGNFLKKKCPEFTFSSAHVGSLGGLVAIKRGEAHCAGTHLLDEDTEDYNVGSIRRLLPEKRIMLINFVYRQQGFLVKRGNPKGIRGFEDLTREDVVFVNRQVGAGTRLLTDMHLKKLRIDPERVKGYIHEEYTHMAVGIAVISGVADTGLAVFSAAKALGLDFIPLARERYDLAIPLDFYTLPHMDALLTIIREDMEFRAQILNMGGYDVSEMGNVMAKL